MADHPVLLHTAIDARDCRGLAEFYRQLLGLRYRDGDEPPADGIPDDADWLVLLDDAGTRILDPDPEMLAELRKHVPDTVTTVLAAFEDLPLGTTYDLVYAAASLHWTDPESRWERIAALVGADGIFASFGGPYCLADDDVRAREEEARRAFLPQDDRGSPDGTPPESPMQWPGTELQRSGLFTDVRQVKLERRLVQPASDYVDHLSTVSYYLQFPEPTRSEALAAILGALPDTVEIAADTTLHLARPVGARRE